MRDRPASPLVIGRREWIRRVTAASALAWWGAGSRGEDASARSPWLVHSEEPFNAETRPEVLLENWITPVEKFYVRCNAPVPQVDLSAYRLSVEGLVAKPLTLTAGEIRERFPGSEVTATLACAGNRREEYSAIRPAEGLQWQGGALGNAVWGGVPLAAVLRAAEVAPEARHVWFEGLDVHEKRGQPITFGASIPLERALADDPQGRVLVCDRMNGELLTAAHGAPWRVIVPGYIGARSVKWLSKIVISDRPSDNTYVTHSYRLPSEDTPEAWGAAPILYGQPLQSLVCAVTPASDDASGSLTVSGYAMPSGDDDAVIERVELSLNGGRTWRTAQLDDPSQPYCWRFWSLRIRRAMEPRRVLVRAIDSRWRMQPESVAWNVKGYMYNAWHSVEIPAG